MGIATHSTIKKTRLSTAPPWGAVSTVRPAPGGPGDSQPGVLDLPEVQELPQPETRGTFPDVGPFFPGIFPPF